MIGVFDSGIGGLTVVRALMEQIPGYDIVYFGDTARTPYGTKSPAIVKKYAVEDTEILWQRGAKLIVIACNTASSLAADEVVARFDAPVFEVIAPAVAHVVGISKKLNIGVIGTRATIASGIYEKKIKELRPQARVYSQACPLLVPLVEEGWFKKPATAMIVKKYLYPLKLRKIDTLILGCTHYPLLKELIQRKIGTRVRIVDSSVCVAEKVKAFLRENKDVEAQLSKNGRTRILVSDVTEQFAKTARITLKRDIELERVRI